MHLSVFLSFKVRSFCFQLPAVQLCYWVGFRISLSLSREGAIFREEIKNYFSCSQLARRDRDYNMTILVFWDKNKITYCYSWVLRRDRDFRKAFLVAEREKMKLTLVDNSRDREFSLNSTTQKDFLESNSPALLCLGVQKWVKCDNRVKPVRMFSNLICSPMMVCKSDKVVINKKNSCMKNQ